MSYLELIPISRCRPGAGTFVAIRDRELAVFWLSDPERVFVVDNACPHAGGNLSGGEITSDEVTCPWHHWTFRLTDGVCTHSSRAAVRRYPAEIRGGAVWVDLDGVGPSHFPRAAGDARP